MKPFLKVVHQERALSLESMASLRLRPSRTGLPFDILLIERSYASSRHNRRRLKLSATEKGLSSSVSINDPIKVTAGSKIIGKDLQSLIHYIKNNQGLLMQLWNEEIDQVDYGNKQTSI